MHDDREKSSNSHSFIRIKSMKLHLGSLVNRRVRFYVFFLVAFSLILFSIFQTLKQRHFINGSVQINETILTFPKSHSCSKIDQKHIEIGRKHFSQRRILICGLIRDREQHLSRFRRQISEITKLFADYAVIIVENDSKDRTREALRRWTTEDHRIHLLGCPQFNQTECRLSLAATKKEAVPSLLRIEKMVRLRNLYMDYIDKQTIFHHFDYVIVEDYDLTTLTFVDGFFSTGFHFDRDPTIDAICANGIFFDTKFHFEFYYDPYAHQDFDQDERKYDEHLRSLTYFRHYRCQDELKSVKSCFSGRTIYRYENIRDKRYRTYLNRFGEPICEHVGLHESLKNIYLNGQMVFYIIKNNLN